MAAVSLPLRRPARVEPASRAAVRALVGNPLFELIPLRNALDQAAFLPPGALVSVTASPAKGMEATIELAAALRGRGYVVVPHLSAHMIRDRAHLGELLRRMDDAGIDRVFVVGGDATDPGEYRDGLSLLRAMADLGHQLREVGVSCYPQGHPTIPEDVLLAALAAKAPLVDSMTTQLCFDPLAIETWLRSRRADGIALPAVLGVPGAVEPHRLLSIAARIGFYRPDALLADLGQLIADPAAGVSGIHLYTFNAVEATEAWRERYLAQLGHELGQDP